jgi:uncharacterized membrane protein YeaQ/YmgE (transglycosylase-associated protein family)
MNFIISIIIGGVAGWLAGKFMKGEGYGAILNIILGLIGGSIGSFVFSLLGFRAGEGFIPQVITSAVGAVLLIWVYRKWIKS